MSSAGRFVGVVCLVIFAVSTAGGAWAGGVEILENGRGQGNSNAGVRATADDPTTVWWNPAGMTRLDRNCAAIAGHLIIPKGEFIDAGSARLAQPITVPFTGETGETDKMVGAGGLFGAWKVHPCWRLGLAVNAPYGLATDWGRSWIGRYHGTESELLSVNINPSIAWRVHRKFSVAAGVSAMYAKAELGSAVDFGALLGVPQTADGHLLISGDSWGFGFNFGILWEPNDCTRVGLHYRSRVKQDLEGNAEYEVPGAAAPIVAATGRFVNTGVETSVTFPDSIGLSVYRDVTPRLALLFDVTWTGWSTFDELVVEFANPAEPNQTLTWNWDDTWRVALGTNYQLNQCWILRTGVAVDQSPIPDATRTPRIPMSDRLWLSLGATYQVSDHWSFDFHYTHLFIKKADINQASAAAGALIGEVDGSVDILGLQVNFWF